MTTKGSFRKAAVASMPLLVDGSARFTISNEVSRRTEIGLFTRDAKKVNV